MPVPTTATANDEAFRTLMKMNWQPSIRTVPAYFDNPLYINALANSVKEKYASLEKKPDILVCSYHGVASSLLDGRRPLPLPMPKNDTIAQRSTRLE
jgi:ferrochelatase